MPAYVPDRPAMLQLQATQTGRPTSHRHARAWQDNLHFLLGHNAQVIASFGVRAIPSASPTTVRVAYKRSPGARALMVIVELHTPTTDGAACSVLASFDSAATVPTPGNNDLDGARELLPQFGRWSDVAQFGVFLDVSGLTVGALEWLSLTWTDGTPTGTRGISKVHIVEVPRRAIAEDSSDAGIDGGWPFTGNPIVDGSPTTLAGTVRMLSEIDRARTAWGNFRQAATIESTADAWYCGASVGTWAPVLFGSSVQPGMNCRARRLYETTTDNRLEFLCRYTTEHATAGAQLRITATSESTLTVVTTTVALPASLGFTALAPVSVPIPCDGAEQGVRVVVDFQTDAGAVLRLSHRGWLEAEV